VPFVLVGDSPASLRDIVPTVLGVLGVEQPPEMTGHDLRIIPGA
jgi:bisphosphoglycerate-independent phosphoglycerate mutase (AlkP superfamily)